MLSGCGEHDGMVRGDRDPHGQALRTHWKPGAPQCCRRAWRSENSRRVPQKVAGGAKCHFAVSGRKEMAPQVGLEPTTLRLTAGCSAIELLRSVCALRRRFKFIVTAGPHRVKDKCRSSEVKLLARAHSRTRCAGSLQRRSFTTETRRTRSSWFPQSSLRDLSGRARPERSRRVVRFLFVWVSRRSM